MKGIIYISATQNKPMALERLAIIKQLSELGYRVIVPNQTYDYPRFDGKYFFPIADFLNEAKKYGARVIRTNRPSHLSTEWQRDFMTYVGEKRVIAKQYSQPTESSRRTQNSSLSQGGNLVQLNANTYFFQAEDVTEAVRNEAEKNGAILIPIKTQSQPRYHFATDRYDPAPHVDLSLNVIPGQRVVLVDREILALNPTLSILLRNKGYNTVVTPKSEERFAPANFIHLDKNQILVNSKAVKTIQLLRKMGVQVVSSAVPIEANLAQEGSLRCFSQLGRALNQTVFEPPKIKPAAQRLRFRRLSRARPGSWRAKPKRLIRSSVTQKRM